MLANTYTYTKRTRIWMGYAHVNIRGVVVSGKGGEKRSEDR